MNSRSYIIGDSRNLTKIFKQRKIQGPDLIITSPPYFDIKNYENKKKQVGYGQSYQDYSKDIIDIFQQCFNISSENAALWLIMDCIKRNGRLIPLPFDLINDLNRRQQKSWNLRDVIIWNKYKNVPWYHKGSFKNHFEYILFLTKGDNYKFYIDRVRDIADLKKWWIKYPERYNPKGKAPTNIWEFTSPLRGWGNGCQTHFCPIPFPLIERILSISTDPGDLVLDPFAGSGSVIAISALMKRKAIGIDVSNKYKKRFNKEVIPGAKRYWKKRIKELERIEIEIKKFQELNIKLRKLKYCASLISNIIFCESAIKNVKYFCFNGDENNVTLIFYTKNIIRDEMKIFIKKENKVLSKMFKIKCNLNLESNEDFIKNNISKIYEYDLKETNCFSKVITNLNIDFKQIKNGKLYSDILINIKKPNDFFNKKL